MSSVAPDQVQSNELVSEQLEIGYFGWVGFFFIRILRQVCQFIIWLSSESRQHNIKHKIEKGFQNLWDNFESPCDALW